MKKFLIIQTAFIGDVVLATPLIEKLSKHFRDASIDLLVRKGNEGLVKNHPKLRKTFIWDKEKAKYPRLLLLLRLIRKQEYDYVINIQRFWASGFLTCFSGAEFKVGFAKNPFSFCFNIRAKHEMNGLHETSRNLQLIKSFTNGEYERPKLYPSDEDYVNVEKYRERGQYVCIAPTSVWYSKQYPAEKWLELILRLPDEIQIYLLGGKNDYDACEEIIEMAEKPQVKNLAGKLSLLESAVLIEHADLNYVNDSAPLHIASAMNARTAAVFLSTVPSFGFGPLGNFSTVIETKNPNAVRPFGIHGKRKSQIPTSSFMDMYDIDVEQFPIPEVVEP